MTIHEIIISTSLIIFLLIILLIIHLHYKHKRFIVSGLKYNVGDKVLVLIDNKVETVKIKSINIYKKNNISYYFDFNGNKYIAKENELIFPDENKCKLLN